MPMFSHLRPGTPALFALGNLCVNAGLDALLYKPVGIGGIPLSTAIVSLVTTLALAAVLRRLIGGLDARRTRAGAVRIVIASAAVDRAADADRALSDAALS